MDNSSSSSSTPLRLRWPLMVLLASIALTALAAFEAQRAVRAQNTVVTRAMREFASFAGWSYGQHLQEELSGAAREVLGAVNHGDNLHTSPMIPPAAELVHYLPWNSQCSCHRPRQGPNPASFISLKLGADTLNVAANTMDDPMEGWTVDQRPDDMSMMQMHHDRASLPAAETRWIVDTLTKEVRKHPLADRGFALVVGSVAGEAQVLSYTVMPTVYGDTLVYAVQYKPRDFAATLSSVLDGAGLLPATFTKGRRNRDVIAVRVSDGSGHLIFDSAPGVASPVSTQLSLPTQFGALALDVVVRPEQAGTLVIGGLPRSRLPFLLGLLALATAMSLVAVAQIRRETELARLRADFVSSVSHELRTPLAQIRLYLETIRLGRAETAERREWSLGNIEREATRLNHLVENVLRFSRLGRLDTPATIPVDVSDETRRIIDEFTPLAEARGARLESDIADTPKIALQPDAVRHLLINLLDNAVKYGPSGQIIRIRLRSHSTELRLSVSDEGPGVVEKDREMIWRPFSRGESAAGAAGSGIGLTIVRDTVTKHGGKAWVEDAPGGGASFVITIPIKSVAARDIALRPSARAEETIARSERETETVSG